MTKQLTIKTVRGYMYFYGDIAIEVIL